MTLQFTTAKSSKLFAVCAGIKHLQKEEGHTMEEFFEDIFDDNIEEDLEIEEPLDGDPEFDDEHGEAESKEDYFTARDAFFLGSAIGWGYEEGLIERKRRKRKKFSDNSK